MSPLNPRPRRSAGSRIRRLICGIASQGSHSVPGILLWWAPFRTQNRPRRRAPAHTLIPVGREPPLASERASHPAGDGESLTLTKDAASDHSHATVSVLYGFAQMPGRTFGDT